MTFSCILPAKVRLVRNVTLFVLMWYGAQDTGDRGNQVSDKRHGWPRMTGAGPFCFG